MTIIDRLFAARALRSRIAERRERMYKIAFAWCGERHLADDLVQEAMTRAMAKSRQLKDPSRLDSWLFRIVQTTWIDRCRAASRRKVTNDTEAIEMVAYDARIAEGTEARRDLAIVKAQTAKLPEKQRLALSLVAIEGMSYQEAADIMKVPIGTVMSSLSRARKKLAAALEAGVESRSAGRPV